MKIKALKPFTLRDADSGELTSIACGAVAVVTDELGASLIEDGLAEVYTLISPSGSQSITENGTYNITDKAEVAVNVGTYIVAYDVNGGTGSVSSQTVIAGNTVTLDNGAGLTPPEGKAFAGWGDNASATEALESPYKPTSDVTIYAIWNDAS